MSVTRTARWAANLSTGLGVTRWSSWLATMGVVAVIALGVGAWGGHRWARGAQALSEVKQKDQQLQALATAAKDIRQAGVDATTEYRAAATKLGTIADDYSRHQARMREFERALDDDRETLLRRRPDLWDCDVGPELLDHFNRAARPGTAGAATGHPAGAAGAVRADAAGHRQPGAAPAADQRPADGGRRRLRKAPGRAG